jgi:adenylyl cyclase-associated protein
VVVKPKAPAPKKAIPKKKKGLPILEYQQRGTKWVVENQTKESAKQYSDTGVIEIDIGDPKQQVYIYNCDEVTIKVNGGKFKSLIIDKCEKVNVVFDSIISGCELVNSKKIGAQVEGVCPVFTIDKTIGVTIWLSEASCAVSSFSTSLSSEMNVSIPDGEDRKEMPIPEQFTHKIADGSVTSEVSDLYH